MHVTITRLRNPPADSRPCDKSLNDVWKQTERDPTLHSALGETFLLFPYGASFISSLFSLPERFISWISSEKKQQRNNSSSNKMDKWLPAEAILSFLCWEKKFFFFWALNNVPFFIWINKKCNCWQIAVNRLQRNKTWIGFKFLNLIGLKVLINFPEQHFWQYCS